MLAGDLDALVIQQAARGVEVLRDDAQAVLLKVQAGMDWHALVHWSLDNEYFGLENLALIPGTMGAAPMQNIGAYGVELSIFVRRVHAVRIDDFSAVVLTPGDCAFGYRDSVFKHSLRNKLVITAVELELSKVPKPQLSYPALAEYLSQTSAAEVTPRQVFDAVVAIRQLKLPDPKTTPNAGSFFKNPLLSFLQFEELAAKNSKIPHYPQPDGRIKIAAAWLIEQCGWKGKRSGNVGVHPDHSLVLVNYGERDGKVLLALADQIASAVFGTYGVNLEIEPRVYGQ